MRLDLKKICTLSLIFNGPLKFLSNPCLMFTTPLFLWKTASFDTTQRLFHLQVSERKRVTLNVIGIWLVQLFIILADFPQHHWTGESVTLAFFLIKMQLIFLPLGTRKENTCDQSETRNVHGDTVKQILPG